MIFVATGIKVRAMASRDYTSVREIEKEIDSEYLRSLAWTGEKDTVTPSVNPSYFRHYLRMGCSFVAEVTDEVVGYVLAQPVSYVYGRGKSLWLEFIAVLPENRRQGIGSRLMERVEVWAKKNYCEAVYTTLNPNNPESKGLLTNRSFQVRDWMMAEKELRHKAQV